MGKTTLRFHFGGNRNYLAKNFQVFGTGTKNEVFGLQTPGHGVVPAEHGAVSSPLFSVFSKKFHYFVLTFGVFFQMSKFTRFGANELDARARYEVLQTRPEEYPRRACTDLLTMVNQLDRFNNIVRGPLHVALTTRLRSVHQCTMEFYNTFIFNSRREPFDHEAVKFRCGGTTFRTSMAQFGAIIGLYSEEEAGNEENTGGLRDLDATERQAAWAQIGEGIYNPSSTKSTKLRDPLYRYIHRLLTYSLNQRHDSSGVVGLKDLVVLHCIHNQKPLDVPYLLLRNMHLNRLAHAPTPIFFGGWVYRLFKHFTRIPRSFERSP